MIDRITIQWAIDNEVTVADLEIIGLPSALIDKLDRHGIVMFEQLLKYTFDELRTFPGVGDGYISKLKTALQQLPTLQAKGV